MAINWQEILQGMSQDNNFPLKLSFHTFETLTSTNQKLWELLDRGATPGTVVIAAQQTSGRGQWGRQWQSEPGGLYLSLALAPNLAVSDSAHLTLCTAWGIATALRDRNIPVSIKWLNDLLLQGKKLGGILTETRIKQERISKAVVGVGINWSNAVPETGINLQSYIKAAPIGSLEMLAAVTLEGMLQGYQQYIEQGIDSLLPAYEKLLSHRGESVTINGSPATILGVTPTGELRVRFQAEAPHAETCFQPGEVTFNRKKAPAIAVLGLAAR